jgi:phosphatidylserine decarboxylase
MRAQTLLEARWILPILAFATVGLWFVSAWLSLIFLALFLFTIAFFRDPDRRVPAGTSLIVAPADGTISDIVDLEEKEVLKMKARRVGIFLSIFDVHTNRAPIEGRIVYRQRHEGLCLDARDPDCPEKNEAMTWAFENPRVTVVVRQLTGAIARRIVAWA